MSDPDMEQDSDWKQKLTPEQYEVMRKGKTETPFIGAYVHEESDGMYYCAACGVVLFSSDSKFDSGTGWPSFDSPANKDAVEYREGESLGIRRTEVLCKKCGSHLGHVFEDGPTVTGKRYCINSVCLDLEQQKET